MSLKEELYKLYWKDKLSQRKIGEIYSKSPSWVYRQMKKCEILTRNNLNIKDRFLNFINIPENVSGCWEWLGYKDRDGYGVFRFEGEKRHAHRVSYSLFVREFDPVLFCLHTCDNPSCVNPIHLFLGNTKDNMVDMKQKGRNAKGEKHGMSKLTEKEVKEIKMLLRQGLPNVEISRLVEVKPNTVSDIKRGRTWKHIQI